MVERFGPLVYGWARRDGHQPVDAEDICQEVFLAVARRIHDFRRDTPGQSFRLWLWIITKNKLADRIRRVARRGEWVGDSAVARHIAAGATPHPAEDSVWSDQSFCDLEFEPLAKAVATIQSQVKPTTWQAFWLLTVEHRSASDVAAELGLTCNNVYVARSRVIRRLRNLLPSQKCE